MKILFSGYHNPNFLTITEYIENAIEALGYTVIPFEDRGFITPGRIRERVARLQQWDLKQLNKRLLKVARMNRPDICLMIGGHRISSETVKDLKREGIRTVLWTIDAPVGFGPVIDVARDYDHVFCGGTEAIEILSNHNIGKLHWLPFAYDDFLHKAPEISQHDREKYAHDIVFVGSFYPNRREMLKELADYDLGIWGPDWKKGLRNHPLEKCIKGEDLKPEEWLKVFNTAKIIIVIHYQDGITPCYQASPKVYETLASRGLVMCDNQKDVKTLFEDQKHLVIYNDAKDLKNKIDHFLTDDKKRNDIVQAAQNEVGENHTYKNRIKKMLRVIENEKIIQTQKIKILHLVEDLDVGGMESVVASIARGLNKDKYDLKVWCIDHGGENAESLIRDGIDVKVLNIKSYHNPLAILKMASLLRKERFDIVHSHGYFATTSGRIAGILARVPRMISHIHTIFYNLNKRNMMIDQFLNRRSFKIVYISKAIEQSFVKAGYNTDGKATLIYNGAEGEFFERKTSKDGKKIVIIVASLTIHKGHRYLLSAMKDVVEVIPEACLWVVGEGPLKSELEEEVRNLGINNNVAFLGKRNDVPKLLAQSDCFVLSSIREGVPLSILEAMASGLPVVATRVGGIEEMVIDHENGILCQDQNPEELVKGIKYVLEDSKRAKSLGLNGRRIFEEKFSQKIMLEKLDELYEKCSRKQ